MLYKTEVRVLVNGDLIRVKYDDKGYLETVYNDYTEKFLIIEIKMKGCGYTIAPEKYLTGGESDVCDARYARIPELDIFVPRRLYIPNKEQL